VAISAVKFVSHQRSSIVVCGSNVEPIEVGFAMVTGTFIVTLNILSGLASDLNSEKPSTVDPGDQLSKIYFLTPESPQNC
jgi:hypothetical protein